MVSMKPEALSLRALSEIIVRYWQVTDTRKSPCGVCQISLLAFSRQPCFDGTRTWAQKGIGPIQRFKIV